MIRLSPYWAGELESLLQGGGQVQRDEQMPWAAVLETGGQQITVAIQPSPEAYDAADYVFATLDTLHRVRMEVRQDRWNAKICPYSDNEGLAGCLLSLFRAAVPARREKMREFQHTKAQNNIRDTLQLLDNS